MIPNDLNTLIQLSIKLPTNLFFNRNGNGTILFQDNEGDDTEFYVYIVKHAETVEELRDRKYYGIRITKYQSPEKILLLINDGIKDFMGKLNGMA